MKKIELIIILTLIVIIGGTLYWWNKDNFIGVKEKSITKLSPTQVESIEAIGQWEFLAISDEELIDTMRHGFFGDDELVRIYYGTLRLGIDMQDVKEDWIAYDISNDSIICTLPPVKLLDNNFIDEARTKSFFESGKWTGADRQDMYDRAYAAMKRRCLSKTNITTAENNAQTQFLGMFKALGHNNVKVQFEK